MSHKITATIMTTNNLRSQYYAAVRRYRYKEANRLALQDEFNVGVSNLRSILFANLNYNKIYEKGITRVVNGQTVRYKGDEAIRVQIQSLRNQTSKTMQKQLFIQNYKQAMRKTGYSEEEILLVENKIQSFSSDQLTIALAKGDFPNIYYVYGNASGATINDLLQEIQISRPNINAQRRANMSLKTHLYNKLLKQRISAR